MAFLLQFSREDKVLKGKREVNKAEQNTSHLQVDLTQLCCCFIPYAPLWETGRPV